MSNKQDPDKGNKELSDALRAMHTQLELAKSKLSLYLSKKADMLRHGLEGTDEYAQIEQKAASLQALIDKWQSVYQDRLRQVEEAETGIPKRRRRHEEK